VPINRRLFLQWPTISIVLAVSGRSEAMTSAEASDQFAALEAASKGRLGVTVLDTASGERLTHRGDERFAMLSTFKALAAGCVLWRVDRNDEKLDRRVMYLQHDVCPTRRRPSCMSLTA
jgi:beta-lactamase class A